jgi:hypothetical protein
MRSLFALVLAIASSAPASAQFAITLQQNGQALNVANGASLTLNAQDTGQIALATVKMTYLGNTMARFPSAAQLLGSTSFTVTGSASATTLNPLQSLTFELHYAAPNSAQTLGQFFWPYNELSQDGATKVSTGAISFNLVGTAPNLTVGQITANGSFQIVPNGEVVPFPDTLVNAASAVTIAIANSGSGPGTVNSLTATGDGYQLRGVPLLPITLNAGTQISVVTQFQPTSPGSRKGSLQAAFGSGNYSAILSGNGVSSFLTYTVTRGSETVPLSPDQTIAFADTKVGFISSIILQFRNSGTTPFALSTFGLSGAGFATSDGPFLPLTLQPQQSNSITLTYSPTRAGLATGRLIIGNDTFLVSASGIGPLLQFSYQVGGANVSVNPGEAVSFPPTPAGQTAAIRFNVSNTGTAPASLTGIGITDNTGVFRLTGLPALPSQLEAAGSAGFTVTFAPLAAGTASSSLLINNQAFGLTAFSSVPSPLSEYHFTGASGTQQAFQQPAIGLSLNTPYPFALAGVLTLTVIPASFAADPAVQFSFGGRQVAFTIPANTLEAVFPNGATQVRFQTGTVASAIQVAPVFSIGGPGGADITPANPTKVQFVVPSESPTILAATLGSRSNTGFSIVLAGFSTTRFLDHLTFEVTPSSGSRLQQGVRFTVDLTAQARVWFQGNASQNSGGQFTIEVPFSLAATGASATDLTKSLAGVTVSAANEAGSSNAVLVALP